MMEPVVTREPDLVDPRVCPLLGLAADHRTRYSFPNPAHRCFATEPAGSVDAGRQTTLCFTPEFGTCERLEAWRRQRVIGGTSGPKAGRRFDGLRRRDR